MRYCFCQSDVILYHKDAIKQEINIDSCFLSKKQESYLTRSLQSKERAPRNAEFLREIPISRARSHTVLRLCFWLGGGHVFLSVRAKAQPN